MKLRLLTLTAFLLACLAAHAGGPLRVGSPTIGVSGQPTVWDMATMPIQYFVDTGAMSATPTGTVVVSNQQGLSRVQSMLAVWSGVSTANVQFNYAGPLPATGSFVGGHVASVADYNAVVAACKAGQQAPIIFDSDGSLFSALGLDAEVIGFAGPCAFNAAGKITAAQAVLNGQMQDGISTSTNLELTAPQFDEAMLHEFGHFLGLDHSQINLSLFTPVNFDNCPSDAHAGLPVMFPIFFCQARVTAGLPPLSPDDIAWISKLYPSGSFATSYGTISGYILFSDGVSGMQGVNVIARRVDDPAGVAVSVVSGYLFTGNPGQSVTAKYLACNPASECPGGFLDNNVGGSNYGSRDASLIGYYEISVPPGTYTLEIEAISQDFDGGSSVGPLSPPALLPGPAEFWHQNESATDDVTKKDTITVTAGQTVSGTSIIVNNTPPRYDQFEDGISQNFLPREEGALMRRRWSIAEVAL